MSGNHARSRLLVTTVFGSTDTSALTQALNLGVDVRVLNPGGRTFHPKVYLGRRGERAQAVIGSANLTAGLATNYEAGVWLRGSAGDPQLASATEWAERLWADPRAANWEPQRVGDSGLGEPFSNERYSFLSAAVRVDPVFLTLRGRKPNRVVQVEPDQLLVETGRSRERGPPEKVPAWMFNLAFAYLQTHGELDYPKLTDGLRVHRSSAVLAILARHPSMELLPGRVALRLRG